MRIGMFTDTYHPAVNGVSFVIDITKRGLEELGHEVYLFAPKPGVRGEDSNDPYIIRYPAIKGVSWEEDMTSMFFPPREIKRIKNLELDLIHFFTPDQVGLLGALAAIKNDTPLVAQYSTDIIEYARYYPGVLKALLAFPIGAPLLLKDMSKHWRKIVPFLESGGNNGLDMWRQRFVVQFINALHAKTGTVLALSPKMYNKLMSFDPDYDITLLPTGVNPSPEDKTAAQELRDELKLNGKKVVLSVGRLGQEKNIELLIEAFSLLREQNENVFLLIVGGGEYAKTLEKISAEILPPDSYHFSGIIEHELLPAYYGASDVFAFPSLTDTQGLVLNEAAGQSLPIVAIDKQVNEVAEEGKNTLYAMNNEVDFCSKLTELLENEELNDEYSKASRELAAKFDEKTQIKKLVEIYESIIARH